MRNKEKEEEKKGFSVCIRQPKFANKFCFVVCVTVPLERRYGGMSTTLIEMVLRVPAAETPAQVRVEEETDEIFSVIKFSCNGKELTERTIKKHKETDSTG